MKLFFISLYISIALCFVPPPFCFTYEGIVGSTGAVDIFGYFVTFQRGITDLDLLVAGVDSCIVRPVQVYGRSAYTEKMSQALANFVFLFMLFL